MAYTGIAATLLPNGKTVHKIFGLPVPMFNDSTSNIKVQSKEAEKLKKTTVFIWDEAPMAPRYALDIATKVLKDIMGNNLPFGGKLMILGGDFKQLLPIKVRGTRNEILNLFIKYEVCSKNDYIDIPHHCILPKTVSIIDDIFGQLIKDKKFDEMSSCAILSARNEDVDKINRQITDLLDDTDQRFYTAIDTIINKNNGEFDDVIMLEHLNALNPPCLPPYKLHLKKKCIVMLIRNISINEGLCNGTRLQVIDLSNHLIKCKILTGDKTGQVVFLNRITLYCENEYPFAFKRRQFRVKLAFAMTINKAQGQTFRKVVVDLRKDVFSHGQFIAKESVNKELDIEDIDNDLGIVDVILDENNEDSIDKSIEDYLDLKNLNEIEKIYIINLIKEVRDVFYLHSDKLP
ncbi:ATP-dependent DNA helicase pif1-like [Phymastichus coffea]|uniref:ATP-dependent DNA helicase pif1-like n=1 Tax=Phymastichus coffea TaxID=108790 RepID=UPI00273C7A16|nr:ATP-dependent DNA helicase pif1-like [Phymastichus coffea]